MEIGMPKQLIMLMVGLVIFAWFVIGERFLEKFLILLVLVGLYVGYMLLTGASIQDIFSIFQ